MGPIQRHRNDMFGMCLIELPTSYFEKGVAPYVGLNFSTYDTLKKWIRDPKHPEKEASIPHRLVCGGVAGAVAQTGKLV